MWFVVQRISPLNWYFQQCKWALPKPRDSRNYRLLTDFSALNAFPRAPKSGSSLLFPSVIWNVITHHFGVLQEADTYVSLSAPLPHPTFWLFSYASGGLYIFCPHTFFFEHYPCHYLCKWLGRRQNQLSYAMTTWELVTCNTGYQIISLPGLRSGNSVCGCLRSHTSIWPWFFSRVWKKWTRGGVQVHRHCALTRMRLPVAAVDSNAHARLDVM